MKQPIAMRCTKKQWKQIKDKLNTDLRFIVLVGAFKDYKYLTNYYNSVENEIGFTSKDLKSEKSVLYEEWNEKIFLEACGIEVEKTFSITESQINRLNRTSDQGGTEITIPILLKEWFPEAFESEVKLEVGKWYKSTEFEQMIIFIEEEDSEGHLYGYGFDKDGQFIVSGKENINLCLCNKYAKKKLIEATEQEVFEALKNEAVKRGYKLGVLIKNAYGEELISKDVYSSYDYKLHQKGYFLYEGFVLFESGKWAEIIPTISLSEAEQQLKKKIIV